MNFIKLIFLIALSFFVSCSNEPQRASKIAYACVNDSLDVERFIQTSTTFGNSVGLQFLDRGFEAKEESKTLGATKLYSKTERPLLAVLKKSRYFGSSKVVMSNSTLEKAVLISYFYSNKFNEGFSESFESFLRNKGFRIVASQVECL